MGSINKSKSKLMCFIKKQKQKNRISQIPLIQIDNKEFEFTTNHTILGLELEAPKLTWKII